MTLCHPGPHPAPVHRCRRGDCGGPGQLLAGILANATLARIELSEDAPPHAIIREIENAAVRAAEVLPYVIRQHSQLAAEAVVAISGLTQRQREILRLVVRGHTNAEIAAEIFVSVPTVVRAPEW